MKNVVFWTGVHHTDADRKFAYDRESTVGKLDKALNEAGQKDCKRVCPFQK